MLSALQSGAVTIAARTLFPSLWGFSFAKRVLGDQRRPRARVILLMTEPRWLSSRMLARERKAMVGNCGRVSAACWSRRLGSVGPTLQSMTNALREAILVATELLLLAGRRVVECHPCPRLAGPQPVSLKPQSQEPPKPSLSPEIS